MVRANASRAATASSMVADPRGTNGATSTTPNRGCAPSCGAQVESQDRGRGHGSGGHFAHNRDHGAVMIAIDVHVEQLGSGIAGDQLDDLGSAAFTQIDDALEHDEAVTWARDRSAGGRKG